MNGWYKWANCVIIYVIVIWWHLGLNGTILYVKRKALSLVALLGRILTGNLIPKTLIKLRGRREDLESLDWNILTLHSSLNNKYIKNWKKQRVLLNKETTIDYMSTIIYTVTFNEGMRWDYFLFDLVGYSNIFPWGIWAEKVLKTKIFFFLRNKVDR